MQTLEYRTYKRDDWGPGPWQAEPDKKQWQDAATGLPCLIVRNSLGGLCGYVGVPQGHPWFEQDYNSLDADVHGGLTFASHCSTREDFPGERLPDATAEACLICHKVDDGEDDNVWWLGFDTSHCGDLNPSARAVERALEFPESIYNRDDVYRDWRYVTGEVESLAKQAMEAAKNPTA